MKAVYRYDLKATEKEYNEYPVLSVQIPKYAKIIKFGFKFDVPCVWAIVMVTDEVEMVERRFLPLGTGIDIPEIGGLTFRYTDSVDRAPFVFHFFEIFYGEEQ